MSQLFESLLSFYEIDLRRKGGPQVYFHPGLNEFGEPVVWTRPDVARDGQLPGVFTRTYEPLPILIDSAGEDATGRSIRPRLSISNVRSELDGTESALYGVSLVSLLIKEYDDLNGCLVIHRQTMGAYLDAANFRDGNDFANPLMEGQKAIFVFERKVSEKDDVITWELSSALDLEGQFLPAQTYGATLCPAEYRSELCGYTGTNYFDASDKPVATEALDVCGGRLSSCEARFGVGCELRCRIFPATDQLMRG